MTRRLPPPHRASRMDFYRLMAAAVSLVAAAVIISRLSIGEFSPIGLMMAVAFLAFALYRLNLAVRRYVQYLRSLRPSQSAGLPSETQRGGE